MGPVFCMLDNLTIFYEIVKILLHFFGVYSGGGMAWVKKTVDVREWLC